jgi:hypothetical protein
MPRRKSYDPSTLKIVFTHSTPRDEMDKLAWIYWPGEPINEDEIMDNHPNRELEIIEVQVREELNDTFEALKIINENMDVESAIHNVLADVAAAVRNTPIKKK